MKDTNINTRTVYTTALPGDLMQSSGNISGIYLERQTKQTTRTVLVHSANDCMFGFSHNLGDILVCNLSTCLLVEKRILFISVVSNPVNVSVFHLRD